MKCFYHVDNDGKCAGYWVRFFRDLRRELGMLTEVDSKEDYRQINYGYDFPLEDIKKDEEVYIVDYSISTNIMDKLLAITPNVIWIDHHISAIEAYADYDKEIKGLRYDGIAGCMLTFCYLTQILNSDLEESVVFRPSMVEAAPYFTKLIGDRDVWTFEYGDDTNNFNTALRAESNMEPYDTIWDDLLNNPSLVTDYINEGKIMNKYKSSFMKSCVTAKGFETVFDGYKAYALNMPLGNSDCFESIDKSQYSLFIIFSYSGKRWIYGLYSDSLDVSDIAKSHGGGGHKGAAGFSSNELLLHKDTMFDHILPCACCGKYPRIVKQYINHSTRMFMQCSNMLCNEMPFTRHYVRYDGMIDAWNGMQIHTDMKIDKKYDTLKISKESSVRIIPLPKAENEDKTRVMKIKHDTKRDTSNDDTIVLPPLDKK